MAEIISVNISAAKGTRKAPAASAELRPGHGVAGDGHAGGWHRQLSLLAAESIEKIRAKGLDVGPGDFAENITTGGIDLVSLPVGTLLRLGGALVRISQIGKKCHGRCEIFRQAGDCVMPREGVFAVVLEGATISAGDAVSVVGAGGSAAAGRASASEGSRP
ncbi:MAG: MOSC domain-containing protein [Thermoleophilia bacterium]